jgi:excisionase family DNA binding protein
MRPDAELLRAVYQQTDRIDELTSEIAAVLGRLERLEERTEAGGDVQAALNTVQAAELLGVTPRTVYTLVKDRRVPFIRLGSRLRFSAADLDAWLAERTTREVRRGRR